MGNYILLALGIALLILIIWYLLYQFIPIYNLSRSIWKYLNVKTHYSIPFTGIGFISTEKRSTFFKLFFSLLFHKYDVHTYVHNNTLSGFIIKKYCKRWARYEIIHAFFSNEYFVMPNAVEEIMAFLLKVENSALLEKPQADLIVWLDKRNSFNAILEEAGYIPSSRVRLHPNYKIPYVKYTDPEKEIDD